MQHINLRTLVLWALLTVPAGAIAQSGASDCLSPPFALPSELAGWNMHSPAEAATSVSGLTNAIVIEGHAVQATLHSVSSIQYSVPPEKIPDARSYGGLFSFTVRDAGHYRIALGAGAWIDVLKVKTPMAALAHGHGPACSGIHKMVDFALIPGRYTMQISGADSPMISILLTRAP